MLNIRFVSIVFSKTFLQDKFTRQAGGLKVYDYPPAFSIYILSLTLAKNEKNLNEA
ncbi:MAG TPA: hypothetical protein PK404_03245 [Fervidobacterium sp.]|nr:hypothetical protein [Fervidobacterium sp.]